MFSMTPMMYALVVLGMTTMCCRATADDTVCQDGNYIVNDKYWRHADGVVVTNWDVDAINIIDGAWYRFQLNGSNAVIPAGCITDGDCGGMRAISFYPNTVEPAEGQAVEAEVCDHNPDIGTCCRKKYTITVRRCPGFTVYKLKTPKGGNYCAIPE